MAKNNCNLQFDFVEEGFDFSKYECFGDMLLHLLVERDKKNDRKKKKTDNKNGFNATQK